MTIRRLRRAPVELAPVVPQIAIKPRRNLIVECPTDDKLVYDVLRKTPRVKRPQRKDGYVHVSDLIGKGKCMRRLSVADKFGTPLRSDRLNIFDRITFAIGDAIHDTVKKIASEGGPNLVWGLWRCSCGHLYHDEPCVQSEIDPDDICPLCGTGSVFYKEVPVFNEEYRIVGNPDLLLYLAIVEAFHVVELKSIAHEQWVELVRPLPEHVLQVVFYWWLMIESGRRVTDRISVVYITKGYQFKGDAVKEFMIDPRAEIHRLLPFLDDAMRAKMSITLDVYPLRKVCSGEFTTKAKQCEVCDMCFSLPSR